MIDSSNSGPVERDENAPDAKPVHDVPDSRITPIASQPKQPSAVWQALGFAWDFGAVVVIPLVVLGVGGRYLDKQFGTTPWLFLAGVLTSIVASVFLLVFRLKKIIAKITKQFPPKT